VRDGGVEPAAAEAPAPAGTRALLEVRGLSKGFGGTQALAGVDLTVLAGEVHALVGQNGSGKSTLIKILSGYHAPDAGSIEMDGARVRLPLRPGEPEGHGLAFLHQETSLSEGMSVLENLRLGRYETTWYGRLLWRRERGRVRRLLESMGLDLDPDLPIRDVPQAERALIGFVRAAEEVSERKGVLVLDEPTASLPAPAVAQLFEAIRGVAARGSSVLFVSHRLEEVLEISDRISVIRDGRLVGTVERAGASEGQLIEMMLGRALGELYPARAAREGERFFGVHGLTGKIATDISFDVHRGEVIGLTGLVGMGQDEVLYLAYGSTDRGTGAVTVGEKAIARPTPQSMRKAGVALLPADRARESGTLGASVLENVTLPVLGRFFSGGLLHHGTERAEVLRLLSRFDVRPPLPHAPLGSLSGGNQQKALLAKWLQLRPEVLLLHEPTQGVDIGSRKQIFEIIREVAASGTGVVIASAEYEDLAHLCNRVLVMRRGRLVAELTGGDLSEDRIIEYCYRSN
jgi:ribose transport system ATP-binding protein